MSEVLEDIEKGLAAYSQRLARVDEFFAAFGEGDASLWQGDFPAGYDLFEAGGYNDDFPSADCECWGQILRAGAWLDPYCHRHWKHGEGQRLRAGDGC